MRAWLLVLLLVTGPLLAGCLGGDDGTDEPVRKAQASVTSGLGGVEGVVTDGAIQPVEGVRVTLVEINESTETRSDGSFAFSEIQPGSYTLTAQGEEMVSDSQQITVRAEQVTVVDFVLARLFTAEPFTQQWELAGFFECGFGAGYNLSALPAPANVSGGIISIAACAFVNSVGGNATNDRFSHVIEAEAPIETLVVETIWDPGAGGFSDQLWVDVVPEDHPCGSIETCEFSYLDHWGPTPLVGRVDEARFQHVQEFYNQECAAGEDEWCGYNMVDDGWPLLLRVFPRWECTPAGPQGCVLVQQEFSHFASAFYNAPAPDGFTALS